MMSPHRVLVGMGSDFCRRSGLTEAAPRSDELSVARGSAATAAAGTARAAAPDGQRPVGDRYYPVPDRACSQATIHGASSPSSPGNSSGTGRIRRWMTCGPFTALRPGPRAGVGVPAERHAVPAVRQGRLERQIVLVREGVVQQVGLAAVLKRHRPQPHHPGPRQDTFQVGQLFVNRTA